MSVSIRDKKIGHGHPTFITFEAGPTHDGLETAKRLTQVAADSGADAIKFQIIDPDRLVADRSQLFQYDVLVDRETGETETVSEPLYDLLKRRSMSFDEWKQVKAFADQLGLAFFATIGFDEEIDMMHELGCDSIKIASADVNHWPFLKKVAKTGMSIQLDTGNATLGEIEEAVEVILAEGNEQIIIHQCPSGYPARLDSIHLRMIQTLDQMFGLPTAFSDHTPGWDMDIAAIALGTNLVEKTITLDRTTRSVEHVMSIEPHQGKAFVQAIRDLEVALGENRRTLSVPQIEQRNKIRRSAFFKESVKSGGVIDESTLEYRRPGTGIPPTMHERLIGQPVNRDVEAGEMVSWSHLK